MNLIKFKDVVTDDELFDTYLKDRYAFWVRMMYVVPLASITPQEYADAEKDPTELLANGIYWNTEDEDQAWVLDYVDSEETTKANNISSELLSNQLTTDSDLTTAEVKKFRTWLASTLLTLDQDDEGTQLYSLFDEDVTHMIEYYAGGMYDDVVKWLEIFGDADLTLKTSTETSCGCCATSNLSSLYNSYLSGCDVVSIYRKNIYELMVEYFGDPDFWEDLDNVAFLTLFKKYIDNILTLGLSLSVSENSSNFTDCGCSGTSESSLRQVLEDLSTALGYIIDDNISGHKNFCSDAFSSWASELYEIMEWS